MAKTLTLVSVPAYAATWIIGNVVTNPKRPGTNAWNAYALFEEGQTVADFAKAHGKGFRSEIEWCAARGFITLTDPAEVPAEETEEELNEADATEVAANETEE